MVTWPWREPIEAAIVPRRARLGATGYATYFVSMCGRVRLSTDYSETRIKLKFDPNYSVPNIPASWNVCPTEPMLVAIRSQDGKRIAQQMRWGLVPWWAKNIKVGFSSINARAETVHTAPAFRDAWKRGSAAWSSRMASMNGRSQRSSPMLLRWRTKPHGDGRPMG